MPPHSSTPMRTGLVTRKKNFPWVGAGRGQGRSVGPVEGRACGEDDTTQHSCARARFQPMP
eukprot:12935540-Prorocentrum_lima.AAC.1